MLPGWPMARKTFKNGLLRPNRATANHEVHAHMISSEVARSLSARPKLMVSRMDEQGCISPFEHSAGSAAKRCSQTTTTRTSGFRMMPKPFFTAGRPAGKLASVPETCCPG